MIEYKCDNGSVSVKLHGGLTELSADTVLLIRNVYEAAAESGGVLAAELFRKDLVRVLTDADGPFLLPLVSDDSKDAGEAEVREE